MKPTLESLRAMFNLLWEAFYLHAFLVITWTPPTYLINGKFWVQSSHVDSHSGQSLKCVLFQWTKNFFLFSVSLCEWNGNNVIVCLAFCLVLIDMSQIQACDIREFYIRQWRRLVPICALGELVLNPSGHTPYFKPSVASSGFSTVECAKTPSHRLDENTIEINNM